MNDAADYSKVSFDFERRTAELPSGPVDYFVAGPEDAEPVLYLHGRGGMRKTLPHKTIAEEYRLYMPIHPGFDGTQFHDGVDSMPALAALYAGFVDAVIGRSCDVIGHSFGGWLAAWLAIGHPDRVELLVLECPAGLRPGGAPSTDPDPEQIRRQLYCHPEKLVPDDRPAGTEDENRRRAPHYHGGMPLDEALMARLGEIRSSTLLLYGTEERSIPIETCRILKERVPNLYLVYVYDAAHAIETDQPERFAAIVLDYLGRGEAFIVARDDAA